MVFSWHFLHYSTGFPIPYAGAPSIFPLALLDEGHTGVALFMVLSGYIFAKLLDGKDIYYPGFLWNRFIRLVPLLIVVLILADIPHLHHHDITQPDYFKSLVRGIVTPELPNGGWSITVESHFYLILPFLLWATKLWRWAPIALLTIAIVLRISLYLQHADIQYLAYYTIIGRVDQFLLGIFAFNNRQIMRGNGLAAAAIALAFMLYYYWFDLAGGFGSIPKPIWIIESTIEGAAYAILIAYYDVNFKPSNTGFSFFLGRVGVYSYSIYLLHPFIVYRLPPIIMRFGIGLSNFYVASAAALLSFGVMIAVSWVSFNLVEKPFLRFRVDYVRRPAPVPSMPSSSVDQI